MSHNIDISSVLYVNFLYENLGSSMVFWLGWDNLPNIIPLFLSMWVPKLNGCLLLCVIEIEYVCEYIYVRQKFDLLHS